MEDAAQGNDRDNKKQYGRRGRRIEKGRHIEFIFTNIGCYHDHHLKAEFLCHKTLRHVFMNVDKVQIFLYRSFFVNLENACNLF